MSNIYFVYDVYIKCDNESPQFHSFIHYLTSICIDHNHIEDTHQTRFHPIYMVLLGEDDPFYVTEDESETRIEIKKQFYIYEYEVKERREIYISFFITDQEEEYEDNNILESWLLHITRQFPELHIHLHYYHIFDKNRYDDDVCYIYLHGNRMIDTYDISMDDYYIKKYGKELLNRGFYILYPIYKELIQNDPHYYKNYQNRFYKILQDPHLMYDPRLYHQSNQDQLFDHLIHPRYKKCRSHFYEFRDFLDKHVAIKDMIIDETTRMIGSYKEGPLIYFQSKIKHKLKLKYVLEELIEFHYLPPYTKETFCTHFENKYLPIYGKGGVRFHEMKSDFLRFTNSA